MVEQVAVMEKFKAQVASEAASGAEAGQDQEQLRDLLLNIGIRSPVTRDTAGTMYHQQLALVNV